MAAPRRCLQFALSSFFIFYIFQLSLVFSGKFGGDNNDGFPVSVNACDSLINGTGGGGGLASACFLPPTATSTPGNEGSPEYNRTILDQACRHVIDISRHLCELFNVSSVHQSSLSSSPQSSPNNVSADCRTASRDALLIAKSAAWIINSTGINSNNTNANNNNTAVNGTSKWPAATTEAIVSLLHSVHDLASDNGSVFCDDFCRNSSRNTAVCNALSIGVHTIGNYYLKSVGAEQVTASPAISTDRPSSNSTMANKSSNTTNSTSQVMPDIDKLAGQVPQANSVNKTTDMSTVANQTAARLTTTTTTTTTGNSSVASSASTTTTTTMITTMTTSATSVTTASPSTTELPTTSTVQTVTKSSPTSSTALAVVNQSPSNSLPKPDVDDDSGVGVGIGGGVGGDDDANGPAEDDDDGGDDDDVDLNDGHDGDREFKEELKPPSGGAAESGKEDNVYDVGGGDDVDMESAGPEDISAGDVENFKGSDSRPKGHAIGTFSSGFSDDASGHFSIYFLSAVIMCIAMYILFHNKQKILAIIVEGRQDRRRRPNSNLYRKLDNSLEEVIYERPQNTRTNIIY